MGNRLFVGNLSFHTTDEDLQRTFAVHGSVSAVKVMTDRETGRSRGFAFIEMASDDCARHAVAALNGASLDGRALRVSEAEERRPSAGNYGDVSGRPRKPNR